MRNIVFVTGNVRKLSDAKNILEKFDISVDQSHLQLEEIQSTDPITISKHKAQQAFALAKTPLVINDAAWNIPSLNGFPGAYLKDMLSWFGTEEFLALTSEKNDRRVCITETVVYIDDSIIQVFSAETWGTLLKKPRGPGNSIEQIAMFNGKTLGEHHDSNTEISNDSVWQLFGKWYSSYRKSREA